MGCSGSTSPEKVKNYEARLFAVCQKFDFDIHSGQRVTFIDLLARENCNELGDLFNDQSCLILLAEFRKFLFLAAAEIAAVRRSSKGYKPLQPIAFNDGNPFVGYDCPLQAPPYVDRVWLALIGYDRQYRIACNMVAQGYIFRKEPKMNPKAALERYAHARTMMYARADKLRPFHNVWPTYNGDENFYYDFVFTVKCPPKLREEFKKHLTNHPPYGGNIQAQWCVQQA